jgi:hypothetical protein
MTQKTADLERDVSSAELGEEEAKDFMERLDAFRETLTPKEQAILGFMVFQASGEQPPAEAGSGELSPPTDEEMDAFTEKLNQFHDELPGEQHLFIDEMLGKTWFKDHAEVQGYHWVRISPWYQITNRQRQAFAQACANAGGDAVRYVYRPGSGHRYAACYDNTHY